MTRGLVLAGLYIAWNFAFQLFVLSIFTYFMARSGTTLGELSEILAGNRLTLVGLGSLFFMILVIRLNPISEVALNEVITPHLFEGQFYPGFIKGAVLACLWTFVFLAFGVYKYLGFFVQSETPAIAIVGLILKALALFSLIYVDEFVFRQKFLDFTRLSIHPIRAFALSAFLYTLTKAVPFYLGISHLLTLSLLGFWLALRRSDDEGFSSGAGLVFGFLAVCHCVFSLPILGNESQGVALLRYQIHFDLDSPWVRYLSGGSGGPLSSILVQFFLGLDITNRLWRHKKTIWEAFRVSLK